MNPESTHTYFPDFEIENNGPFSQEFIKRNISTFKQASVFITELPYARNNDKNNLLTVFSDGHGTCSTKHALLKALALENGFNDLKLFTGIFKMNRTNTPEVSQTLIHNNLDYIPEAHNYLRFNDRILDFTKPYFKLSQRTDDLLEETEVNPNQVTDYKVAYHKAYLQKWLNENPQFNLSLHALWEIREQCIKDLANN